MALESKKELEKNVVELVIAVPAEDFEKAIQKAYLKNKIDVPGFRRGKAPRKIIEKMYGPAVFYDDAIDALYPAAYENAIDEAGVIPVDRANLEIISVDETGFKFKAVVTVKPEINVKEYKGLTAKRIKRSATQEDVEAEIKAQQKKLGRLVEVEDDALTEMGDTVVFDFDGYVDGVAFEGGKASDYSLVLGSGQFIPGFEEQMVGHKSGEEFSVNVKFPEEYHAEELKGKDAEFKIVLHEIKREELPEVNDEFAKDVSDFDTLEEYKVDILTKVQERKDKMSETETDDELTEKVIDLLDAEIPSCMIDNEVTNDLQQFENRFISQGMSLEMYLQYTGQTLEGLREMFRPNSEKSLKARLVLEKIAELEGIVISEEEIDEEYKTIAEANNLDVEKIKSEAVTEGLTKDISIRKAFELVKNHAEITEMTEEEAEKAKKPAAKKSTAKKSTSTKKAAEKKEEASEEKPAAKKTTAKKSTSTKKTAEKKEETSEEKPAAKKTTTRKSTKKAAEKPEEEQK